ncbi:MAG: hypothetical protein IKB60_03140 [Clostridia bacterium]|nr:hypothetical protein [Clostridia bacterium]
MQKMKQGLVPCEDDKPKDAEISTFQAGSNYSLSVTYNILTEIPSKINKIIFEKIL